MSAVLHELFDAAIGPVGMGVAHGVDVGDGLHQRSQSCLVAVEAVRGPVVHPVMTPQARFGGLVPPLGPA